MEAIAKQVAAEFVEHHGFDIILKMVVEGSASRQTVPGYVTRLGISRKSNPACQQFLEEAARLIDLRVKTMSTPTPTTARPPQ